MSFFKKIADYLKGTDRNGKKRLPVILPASAALAVVAAAIIWAVIALHGTTPPSSPDSSLSQPELTQSMDTHSESPTATEPVATELTDGQDPQTSDGTEEPTGTAELTEPAEPVESEKPPETEKTTTTTEKTTQTEKPATTTEKTTQTEKTTGTQPVPSSVGEAAQLLLDGMTLEEKVYQLFIVSPEQLRGSGGTVTQSDSVLQTALASRPVGGVIFFAANIQTPNQTTGLISDLQAASRYGLFIAVDEEGGTVARLGRNPSMGTTAFPPMGEIGATGDPAQAYNVGLTIGRDIRQFGFNLDFAPVADVNSNPNNPVIKDRAFSSDPHIAAEMVAACVEGFRASGVLCTLKHFPGHGDTATDSHYGSASSSKTLEELQACEFLPFKSGIDAGAGVVMLGHIALPNVTGNDMPATLSYEITTGILRNQLGFRGLIVTDAMSMAAITNRFSSGPAAVQALKAGADLILMPASLDGAVSGIIDAVRSGEVSEERLNESVYRILYTKLAQGIIPMR